MSEDRARGFLALLAGNLACVGILLVFPFCANVAGLWRGDSLGSESAHLTGAFAFGLPLAACLALAAASLAFRAERPGSAVPALIAFTLIGVQLLIFLSLAGFSALAPT
jgi:hypothetical protein